MKGAARLAAAAAALLISTAGVAKTWIVPGVFQGTGANGVLFSTDITIANPDTSAQTVTILPVRAPGGPVSDPVAILLGPGETRAVSSLLPPGVPGALRISAAGAISVFARINTTPGNTLVPGGPGSALPAADENRVLGAGESGHSAWVSHSSNPARGARTNVAVVFPQAGAATVTLLDDRGTVLGSLRYDSTGPAFFQDRLDALTSSDVRVGRVTLQVTRGTAWGYTGLIDNTTGDIAIVPLDRLPASVVSGGGVDLVSNGVIQGPGRNGAVWHTDARLANPGAATIAVAAYLRGSVNARSELRIEPGQTLDIPDLVQSLFNVSVPATGAVLWRAQAPLIVSTRVRSGESSPVAASSITGAPPLSDFVTSIAPAADLGDLRRSSQYRTNVLAASGPAGAGYFLDLYDEPGNLLATARRTLPPLAWGQSPIEELFPGAAIPARSRVRVRVESGTVDVRATVVDNLAGQLVSYAAVAENRPVSAGAPVPTGTWGAAPNGMDHAIVDPAVISVFLQCRTGTFPQPFSLDSGGTFAVLGTFVVQAGPTVGFDAILSGQTDGRTLTFRITWGTNFDQQTDPESFVLGGPFQPFNVLCPIDY